MDPTSILQYRPKEGDTRWYTPDRDLLNCWPALIVRGAMYAVDRDSSIYRWLSAQGEWRLHYNSADEAVENVLRIVLTAVNECGRAPLSELLDIGPGKWAAFQAIMCGAGIMAFNDFERYFRQVRLSQGGQIINPVRPLDIEQTMAKWREHLKGQQ